MFCISEWVELYGSDVPQNSLKVIMTVWQIGRFYKQANIGIYKMLIELKESIVFFLKDAKF